MIGWLSGAIVSYVLSRWAFQRKGRPNVLRETVPFWVVSAMVIVVLTLATKFGSHAAAWMHLTGAERVLFVVGVNFLANCVTFVGRFIFFHYVLFADPGSAGKDESDAGREAPDDRFAMAGDSTGPLRAVPDGDAPPRE